MLRFHNYNIILPKYLEKVKKKGSSLALPTNGLGGSRATSLLVAHFALQNTKFGSEKEKVQKPARIHSPDPFLRAGKFSRGFAKSFSPENSFGKTESVLKPRHTA